MAENQTLSKNMQRLADAIRAQRGQIRTALCGFDLWLEAMSSPHVSSREMVPGGTFATGQEAPEVLKVPLTVLGNRIVISLDPSLPPDGFELRA